ncbi:MAG TPA: PIN domain-containing protein [Chthoniobacterales bacterium]
METIHLDTHVAAWLHAGELERIPEVARRRLEAGKLIVSPIVLLELEYLNEMGRLTVGGKAIFADLAADISLTLAPEALPTIVNQSLEEHWTRDVFDRLITAHARLTGCPLATKDGNILSRYSQAFWD